jgi:predicted sugar kinase
MAWEEPRKTGMQYRRLGNSGLHVSVFGLGGWLTFGGHVENGQSAIAQLKATPSILTSHRADILVHEASI